MSNREFTATRTMLTNAFATAGAELLEYMGVSSALAAIPSTEPPRFVVAGTPAEIVKLLPAAEVIKPAAEEKPTGDLTDERAMFEAEELKHSSNLTRQADGQYENPCTQSAWEGWQARAAIAAHLERQAQAESTLTKICDMFQIGALARDDGTILTNVRNVLRRERCLSAIEREFFMVAAEPDEDFPDEDPGEDCLLNWGSEPAKYVEQFRAALAHKFPAPASQEDAHAARNAVLEEAALAAEKVQDVYRESQSGKWPELRDDAETGAGDCVAVIRGLKTPASAERSGDHAVTDADDACPFCEGQGEVQGYGSAQDIDPPIKKCSGCGGSGRTGSERGGDHG